MRRDIFQAIADPTRRAILVLIAVQAMTPNAIAEHFDVTRQAISKHLRILSECDLLLPRPQGREIYYALKIDRMQEVDRWLAQFRTQMEQRFQQLDEVLHTLQQTSK
ncbi:MAG: winged helix-turn-helix transcriptional regulator [Verrucomicrobia bacterium]|nr:winged helix-turn-helix transcriptional regulator [Verrucomicrobiota bacterium]